MASAARLSLRPRRGLSTSRQAELVLKQKQLSVAHEKERQLEEAREVARREAQASSTSASPILGPSALPPSPRRVPPPC